MLKKSLKSSNTWVWYAVGLLALFVLFLVLKKKISQKSETVEETDDDEGGTIDPEVLRDRVIVDNYSIIAGTLREQGVESEPFILMAAAQAAHETDYFSSDVMYNNNNYFGMMQPKVRETVSIGQVGRYASYASLKDSVTDYLLWNNYVQLPNVYEAADLANVKVFVKNLKSKGYFEDNQITYQNGVSRALTIIKTLISAG